MAWQLNTPVSRTDLLGVGGDNDGTIAPCALFNNILSATESAAATSTRLLVLTAHFTTDQQKVIDAGIHCDTRGFTLTGDINGSYGGFYVNSTVTSGGTVQSARGLLSYGAVAANTTLSYGALMRGSMNVDAAGTLSNGYGAQILASGILGGLTYWDCFDAPDLPTQAGTLANSFRSRLNAASSGDKHWAAYFSGTAPSYFAGKLLFGITTPPGTGRLQFVAGTTAADGLSFGADTNLYRSAADTLRTDDTLSVGGDITVASGAQYIFTSRGRFGATTDGEFTLLTSNGSSGNGSLRARNYSLAKSASFSVTLLESGASYHNTGATALVVGTLPASALSGHRARFIVTDTDGLKVATGTSEQIRYGALTTTATTGYVQSTTIGDVLEVERVGTTWFVTSAVGLGWTVV